ncbi:hypothetical protein [Tessaracoccus sp. OH4464_COT-324]|uniref:hypothetical protein n=1 Tax=Tessaracoccus sp. OH4464_COT-324 TaxID=2491059 RepID=UPI000F6392F6|nr:hypothetical protein [Tessaracoccus sp. OH4464_COT-324]RRD47428.1 hypothetical protein EII42_02225 [Tessaracoccus sp. OH4464_COT-324]
MTLGKKSQQLLQECVGLVAQASASDLIEINRISMLADSTGQELVSPATCSGLARRVHQAAAAAAGSLAAIQAVLDWFSTAEQDAAQLRSAGEAWQAAGATCKSLQNDSESQYARGRGNSWSGASKEGWDARTRKLIDSCAASSGLPEQLGNAIQRALQILTVMDSAILAKMEKARGTCHVSAMRPIAATPATFAVARRTAEVAAALQQCAAELTAYRAGGEWRGLEANVGGTFRSLAGVASSARSALVGA